MRNWLLCGGGDVSFVVVVVLVKGRGGGEGGGEVKGRGERKGRGRGWGRGGERGKEEWGRGRGWGECGTSKAERKDLQKIPLKRLTGRLRWTVSRQLGELPTWFQAMRSCL